MGYTGRGPLTRLVTAAVSLCVLAVLPGCGASSPARSSRAATAHSAASRPPSSPGAISAIAIAGNRPVVPSGSQATHAQSPAVSCDSTTFASDRALGARIAAGFAGAGFTASAALLTHFLNGTGTEVDYRAGSMISKEALASAAFQGVNNQVQAAILSQLKAGRTSVRLSAAQLPAVAFESGGDLYWGFRGTQGLSVAGSVRHGKGRYAGTLSYVIRDSYGFPASDTLAGFGPPMRYLQTACGAPQQAGGAHWFPDTIAVTVPFSHPG